VSAPPYLELWPGDYKVMLQEAEDRLREGKNTLLHWHTKYQKRCVQLCEFFLTDWITKEDHPEFSLFRQTVMILP
jgi:hypothetical protein